MTDAREACSATTLRALSEAATPGPISLNPTNRLRVRTSMDHPMCEFSDPYHRQFSKGEGRDPEFMVALWNAYRNGDLVEREARCSLGDSTHEDAIRACSLDIDIDCNKVPGSLNLEATDERLRALVRDTRPTTGQRISFDGWWNEQSYELEHFYPCREAWQTALSEGARRALKAEVHPALADMETRSTAEPRMTFEPVHAALILLCRDALIRKDLQEAYHWLYTLDSKQVPHDPFKPWTDLERIAGDKYERPETPSAIKPRISADRYAPFLDEARNVLGEMLEVADIEGMEDDTVIPVWPKDVAKDFEPLKVKHIRAILRALNTTDRRV